MPAATQRRAKLSDLLVTELRGQIVEGRIAAGDRLPTEPQLAARFGVSRTVVREALARLAGDGLVEARQGAGVFALASTRAGLGAIGAEGATRISMALHVLEVRMPLEIEAAGLAAERRSAAQDAAIQEAYLDFDRLLALGEPTGKADFAFHRAITAATNNPFYGEVLEALGARTIPCDTTSPWAPEETLSPDYLRGLQREHLAILDAISSGDAEGARRAMRTHLAASQVRYRGQLRARARQGVDADRDASTEAS